jgi:HAD superfamily hydrolase (TIGR01509 family)
MLTTLLFDLHGVLINPARIAEHRPGAQADWLTERYGGDRNAWLQAYNDIRADWNSYWADLNLDGETPLQDFWEGELRVLRAHFRLTGTPYPPADELIELVRERPKLVMRRFDASYEETRSVVAALAEAGYALGVVSNAPASHIQGSLDGAGLLEYFDSRLVGSDTAGSFAKGPEAYYHACTRASCTPAECAVFDDNLDGVYGARRTGAHVALIERAGRQDHRPLDDARRLAHAVLPDLASVPPYLRQLDGDR